MTKRNLYKILFLISFWTVCSIFITFYDASVLGFKSEIGGEYYNLVIVLFSVILTAFIGSSILGSLEVLFLGKLLRKKPLGISLVVKTLIYIIFIFFFTSLVTLYLYSSEIDKPMFSKYTFDIYSTTFLSARVIMITIYWGIVCIIALFILQVNEKFGQGVLLNFLLGRYHQPKEDERIFMFMDLKDSTTHAENLGHIKYSRFIQDCFYDITDVVIKHEAKIYQYVGDEVVLSWNMDKGLTKGNCINTFFAYDKKLKSREEYYRNEYGIIPEFKAGVNFGRVTVAEVGEIKKELAYHGDVLNTAARIQSRCNEFQKKILISESLKTELDKLSKFKFDFLGEVLLKGKSRTVNLYDVLPE